ncbi:NADP-dependent oxidoreductase domain-containing protein, partial [Globomyces pollinis-pini]
ACRELGIAIIAYSPLGRGFLTGAIRSVDDLKDGDWRKNNPKFQPGTFEKNFKLVEAFEKLAAKKGVKPSQLCLAWVLSHGTDFIPIPGTKRLSYLEENWKSKDVTLSAEELAEINQIISEIPIEGAQY